MANRMYDLQQGIPNNVFTSWNAQQNQNLGLYDIPKLEAANPVFRTRMRSLGVRRATPIGQTSRARIINLGWLVTDRGRNTGGFNISGG